MISAEKIPNNVNLSGNKRLQRALEHWQPKYIQWWRDMGPQGFRITTRCTSGPPSASIPRAGRISST